MRSILGTLVVMLAVVGCRNQPGAMSNPFMTPDRVPPPSTRITPSGTATPYYPTNALPGAAAPPAAIPGTVPPGTAYPGAAYPGTPVPGAAYPSSAAPLTTPPGGWGSYPQSQSTLAPAAIQTAAAEIPLNPTSPADSIRMSGDQLPLRFPAPPAHSFATPASLASTTTAPTTPTPAEPPTARMPIQSILPLANSQPATNLAPASFPPNAGAQAPQQLQIREITPAEYLAPPTLASASASAPTRDGFRPQSAEPRDNSPSSQSFRPPEIRRDAVADPAANTAADQYGVGENYGWLRGQLEYWPAAGQWSLRYLPVDTPADSLGGRVMIDNPQVLANLQPGEFVLVRGQLYAKPTDAGPSTPAYRVSVIQRQRF